MKLVPISEDRQLDIITEFSRQYQDPNNHWIYGYGFQLMPYGQHALFVTLTENAKWEDLPAEFQNVEVYYRKARVEKTILSDALSEYKRKQMETRLVRLNEFILEYAKPGVAGVSHATDHNGTELIQVQVTENFDRRLLPSHFQGLTVSITQLPTV